MGGCLTRRWGRTGGGGGALTDPSFTSTIVLWSGDGANASTTFPDESFAARGNGVIIGGNTQVDTSHKVYGTGSIRFDSGRNDGLGYNDHADWTLGTSSFTLEG